jgi:hypothetical protein
MRVVEGDKFRSTLVPLSGCASTLYATLPIGLRGCERQGDGSELRGLLGKVPSTLEGGMFPFARLPGILAPF